MEEGCEAGIPWKKLGVSLVLGQDWFPESLRHYLASLIEIDQDNDKERMILATMGMTELGLNVFHETHETATIRRMAQKDSHLRKQLFGTEKKACGYLFHHYPMRFFIEEHADDSLLFTTLSGSTVIPLIRYNSGDCGKLLTYNTLVNILNEFHLEHLNPILKLPLSTMTGRLSNHLITKNGKIFPEDLKLGLYENWDAASQTTGYFMLSADNEVPLVEVQLKPGVIPSGTLCNIYINAFQQYINTDLKIKLYTYNDSVSYTHLRAHETKANLVWSPRD